MADLLSTLQQLIGDNTGLTDTANGGPGPDDARALAQLILGGGRASVGTPIIGGGVPNNDTARELQLGPGRLYNGLDVMNLPVQQGGSNLVPLEQPKPPLSDNFKRVLNTAGQVADSLSPKPLNKPDKTLLPNPYGPGSYDPTDASQVAGIKKQGESNIKLQHARDILTSGILDKLPPGAPIKEITQSIFENAGVTQSDAQKQFEKSFATAAGEKAGGNGKAVIPVEVQNAIGKPEFNDLLTAAVNSGAITDPNIQQSLLRQNQTATVNNRLATQDSRTVSSLQSSVDTLKDLKDSFADTSAAKGGFSNTLKTALAANNSLGLLSQMSPIDTSAKGLTPADIKFATKYNALMTGLRDISGDQRFSDSDAARTVKGIGNPLSGKDVYPEQVQAAIDLLNRRQGNILDDAEAQGRDVSKLRSRRQAAPGGAAASGSAPQQAVDYLKSHPEAKEQFKAKYGYLP